VAEDRHEDEHGSRERQKARFFPGKKINTTPKLMGDTLIASDCIENSG
jgi:hypothetical protein